MKVGVLGGTGNISTSIVRLLLERGHEVVCFNRARRGSPPDGVRTVVCDRKDRPAFEAAVQAERLDAGIDMICFNREDAESSLRAFRGVGHFVHCSTVCTYGLQYDWLPVSEDHPLRPITDYGRNKALADAVFFGAWYRDGFPVTIIKPSTTYGPPIGALRQIAWDFSWLDRIRKGKPILVCGDGLAIHQFLHVDDAALGFVGVLGRKGCLGQTYNLVRTGFMSWADHHRTAMSVLGREVELVGIPLDDLLAAAPAGVNVDICKTIFAHNVYYDNARLRRDVPEFQPAVSLADGLRLVIEAMDREGRIPNSDDLTWEDRLIAAQRHVRGALA
jgi:nucleoside-diphosphate-sugar epimerase